MTESPAWREFEAGDGVLLKLLRFATLGIGIFFLVFAGILELTWPQQAVLGLLTVLLGIWMDRSSIGAAELMERGAFAQGEGAQGTPVAEPATVSAWRGGTS